MASTEPIWVEPTSPMTLSEAVKYMKAIDKTYPINRPVIRWFDSSTGKPVVIRHTS